MWSCERPFSSQLTSVLAEPFGWALLSPFSAPPPSPSPSPSIKESLSLLVFLAVRSSGDNRSRQLRLWRIACISLRRHGAFDYPYRYCRGSAAPRTRRGGGRAGRGGFTALSRCERPFAVRRAGRWVSSFRSIKLPVSPAREGGARELAGVPSPAAHCCTLFDQSWKKKITMYSREKSVGGNDRHCPRETSYPARARVCACVSPRAG